jgi:hypothetical protein
MEEPGCHIVSTIPSGPDIAEFQKTSVKFAQGLFLDVPAHIADYERFGQSGLRSE